MRFFSKKIPIFTAKISDDFFLVNDQVFRIFPFFSQIFCIFTVLKCRRPIILYDPLISSQEKPLGVFQKRKFLCDTFFYSVHTFARIRQHYFSIIGGTDAWAVPPLKFWGTVPIGLRPWGNASYCLRGKNAPDPNSSSRQISLGLPKMLMHD